MFVSDAHLFVPRAIRWDPILAIRYSASRRRKRLMRRLMRDVRVTLPVLALLVTFAMTMVTAEFATLVVPTGATQSAMADAVQTNFAMLD